MSKLASKPVTDSFESYEQFSISGFGKWITVDGDGLPTIQIALGDVSGPLQYPNVGKPMAFQVFNSIEAGIPFTSWAPHTGDQMLVAFKCASPDQGQTEVKNDDWLISPELNGEEQTISFYTKTGITAAYQPEKSQVLYSTTGTDITNFKQVGETVELYNVDKWEEFKFNLPAGAKHFAIRCVSESKFAMLLDDITYIPSGAEKEELILLGYNVYRDDIKVNENLVTATEFVDSNIENGRDYTYHVTAVYDKGESRYSDACLISTTGVDAAVSNDVQISSIQGGIMINGAEDTTVNVFNVGGVRVYSGIVSGHTVIRLQMGVYVVKVGNRLRKVVVK